VKSEAQNMPFGQKEVFVSVTAAWFCIILISTSKLNFFKSLHENYP